MPGDSELYCPRIISNMSMGAPRMINMRVYMRRKVTPPYCITHRGKIQRE